MKIGTTILVADGLSTSQITTNLSTGMTITSNANNFPSSATTISSLPSGGIVMSQAPSGNLNLGTFITHEPQAGDTKIAVRDITGTLEVGMSISGSNIPANTTISTIITPAGNHNDVVRIITLSNALTGIPANGSTLTFSDTKIRLTSAPTGGPIENGMIVTGIGQNTGPFIVTDATNQQIPVINTAVNPNSGATLTFGSDAQDINFHMGNTKYFESDTTNTPIANARATLVAQTTAGGKEITLTDGGAETGSFDF
jgi:hypothetical protein